MAIIGTKPSLIDFLVLRRFPSAGFINMPTPLTGGRARPIPNAREMREAIDTYREELSALAPNELIARYSEEQAKAVEEARLKRERDEQALFFHQPWAKADFSHWSKAADWTLDEAIALSFGKAPEHVTWEKVTPLTVISPFAGQYARRRDLALRALRWKQLFDPVFPGIFLAWAKRIDIAVPPELEAAVAARGVQIADWRSLFEDQKKAYESHREMYERHVNDWKDAVRQRDEFIDELKTEIRQLQAAPSPEKPLGTRERENLLRLVIGMAIGGYGHKPSDKRSSTASDVTSDLLEAGLSISDDTVRKYLQEGADLLPRNGDGSKGD